MYTYKAHVMYIVDFEYLNGVIISIVFHLYHCVVLYCFVIMRFLFYNIYSIYRRKNVMYVRDGWKLTAAYSISLATYYCYLIASFIIIQPYNPSQSFLIYTIPSRTYDVTMTS